MEKKVYFWSPKPDKDQGEERQYTSKHNKSNNIYSDGDQALSC